MQLTHSATGAMLLDMAIAWTLRQLMAERNMWLTTELHTALAEHAGETGGPRGPGRRSTGL